MTAGMESRLPGGAPVSGAVSADANRLEFYGGVAVSFLPFAVFIGAVIALSLCGGFSLEAFVGCAAVGLMLGALFSRNWNTYWDAVMEGITDKSTGILAAIFLLAGIFSSLMANGKLAEGLVWAGSSLGLTGRLFVGFTFLASLLFGLATGTSVGTVITMTPIFYPAGMLLGGNPILLLGAILSGASFGDNLAPVSDTTIISCATQEYTRKAGCAEIGGAVKTRSKYAVIAAAAALVLYLVLGGAAQPVSAQADVLAKYSYPKGLIMLIPLLVVIVLALSGKSIFAALTSGIATGAVVSLLAGILTPADFLRIKDGGVTGIIPSGVGGVFGAIMVYIGIMAMLGVVRKSGALERMVEWLVARVAGTPRGCEATIFVMAWLMDILNAGITTSVVAIVGPIANTLGKRQRLHPYRRANLVDGVGNSWAYFIPWSAFIFIVLGIVGSMKEAYPFLAVPAPTSFFFAVFHAWFLWIVFLTAVVTGFGREFEGEGGRRVFAWFKNRIPEEALRP